MRKNQTTENLKRFFKILKPQTKRALLAGFLMLIAVLLQLPLPLYTKYFIDTILPQKSLWLLNISILILIAAFIIREISNILNEYLLTLFRERAIFQIQLKLFQHIQQLDLSFFKKHQTGYLMSRISSDTANLRGLLADTALSFLRDSLTFIVGLVTIFILSWKLALASLIMWPFFIYSILFFSPRLRSKSKDVQEKLARTSGILQETLSGIYLVKSFLIEKLEARKLTKSLREVINSRIRLSILGSFSAHLAGLLGSFSSIILLWYGAHLLFKGQLTLGTLIAFTALLGYIFGPTHRLINLNTVIQSSLGSLDRVYELIDTKPEITEPEKPLKLKDVFGEIIFKDVNFSYDGKKHILSDINLTARPGETIALVGKSGSGKTTLCNLILRFFDLQEGEILIDKTNIKKVSLRDLREKIGVVPQETFLFSGSIKENIALGDLKARFDEITQSAKLAQIHDFITKLPEGYDTEIGERGTKLSGGERQRISLARAILKNPKITILDEATSELDSETEKLIQKALENLLKNRTTFIIAHRLSTVKKADKIIILDNGKIIGTGTHSELYQTCPEYANLYNLQFSV